MSSKIPHYQLCEAVAVVVEAGWNVDAFLRVVSEAWETAAREKLERDLLLLERARKGASGE